MGMMMLMKAARCHQKHEQMNVLHGGNWTTMTLVVTSHKSLKQ